MFFKFVFAYIQPDAKLGNEIPASQNTRSQSENKEHMAACSATDNLTQGWFSKIDGVNVTWVTLNETGKSLSYLVIWDFL